ncbi:MAG TPA: antibiotic biosynthesis monooxygenase, partial [Paraburkholderia sp.]
MFASTFIFRAGRYDEEFHRLDQQIAEAARSIPGYVGEESWENPDAGL